MAAGGNGTAVGREPGRGEGWIRGRKEQPRGKGGLCVEKGQIFIIDIIADDSASRPYLLQQTQDALPRTG